MKSHFSKGVVLLFTVFMVAFTPADNNPCNTDKIYATKDYLYADSYFKEYEKVSNVPKFQGGKEAIQKFFDENVTLPAECKNMASRYHVIFIVTCRGELARVELKSKPFPGYEEILAACKKLPQWTPAKVKGKEVDCYVRIGFTNQAGTLKVDYREE